MVQNIEQKIKQKLVEKGWTVKKLVADLDMSEIGFAKMLANNSIKLVTLEKIATILDSDIDYFLKENIESLPKQKSIEVESLIEHKLKLAEKEIEYLQKLLVSIMRQVEEKEKVVKTKDELIELLRKKL